MTDEFADIEEGLRAVLRRSAGRIDATAPPWSTIEPRASGRDARERRRPTRRPRPSLGSLTAALAVAVTIAVAVIALSSLHGGGVATGGRPPVVTPPRSPLAGHSPREQDEMFRYLATARLHVLLTTRSCRLSGRLSGGPASRPTDARPPAGLLASFRVLQRPATAADRAEARLLRSRFIDRLGPYLRFVRFVGHRGGVSFYLVPVQQGLEGQTRPRCDAAAIRVMARELRKARAPRGPATLRLASRYLAYERTSAGSGPAVCLLGGGCVRPGPLEERGAEIETGGMGGSRRTLVTAIVPDGPSSITLDIPGGTRTAHGMEPPPISITVPVKDNVAITTLPIAYAELAPQATMILWRAADGRVMKIFERGPSAGP